MGEQTGISWTDHTFNPWEGCMRVSPGCENCYAEARNARFHPALIPNVVRKYAHTGKGLHWGPPSTTPRLLRSASYWQQPIKWNRDARAAGVRRRVFCASLADVFEDHPDVVGERAALFKLIEETPALDWQLLTKRPENMARLAPRSWETRWPDNVWAGVTAENAEQLARRAPYLRQIPARVRFLSCEPLLGPLDELANELFAACDACAAAEDAVDSGGFSAAVQRFDSAPHTCEEPLIHWVIAGGESGPRARRYLLNWARQIALDCESFGVAFFHKQAGDAPFEGFDGDPPDVQPDVRPVEFKAHHGADPAEWPEDLRVQQFPKEAL